MTIELINTGTELMLGRILNTHQQWLCRQLADHGYRVARQIAVDDSAPAIEAALREALQRADLVITTGGLGPTTDDRTRDQTAALLGRKLVLHDATLKHIEAWFARRQRAFPERLKSQALVPEGAIILSNHFGTAPGLAFRLDPGRFQPSKPSWLIMLPGPPRELHPMFERSVLPLLRSEFPLPLPFVCRTLRTTGIGESQAEELIGASLSPLLARGLDLAFCAHVGSVDIRLVAEGAAASDLVREAEALIQARLGPVIYGRDEDELEAQIVRRLTERKETLALAESCTGGHIANRITNVPGASAVLLAGWVTYSNEAKQRLLGVRAESLVQHGAVSEAIAREMAEGARTRMGVDFALSVTGIAGPSGDTQTKPVGTVFIGLAAPGLTTVSRFLNAYDRPTFKEVTSQQALNLIRQQLESQT